MKNISEKEMKELLAIRASLKKKNRKSKNKTSKVVKKNTHAVFKVLVLIVLGSATTFFLTGCTYHPECDQTKQGRGNKPASCNGVIYRGKN